MGSYYMSHEKELFKYLSKKYSQKKQIILNSEFLPENVLSDEIEIHYNDVELFWFIRIPTSDDEIYYYFGLKNHEDNNIYLRLFSKVNKWPSKSFFKFIDGELAIEVKFMEGIENNVYSLRSYFKTRQSEDNKYYVILGKYNRYSVIKNLKDLMNRAEFDYDLNNDCLIIKNYTKNTKELNFPRINQNSIFESDKIDSAIKVSKSIRKKSISKTPQKNKSSPIISKSNKPKSHSETSVNVSDISKISKPVDIKNFTFKNSDEAFEIIKKHFPYDTPKENQIENIIDIINAINEGYKYIVLESCPGKSAIAATLVEMYENSYILTANEQCTTRYLTDFNWKYNEEVFIKDYSEALNLNNQSKFNKRNLLILDDAHRIDENIVNFSSHIIDLTEFDKSFIDKSRFNLNKLENENYMQWLNFLNYLSSQKDEINDIAEDIQKDPNNWVYYHKDDEFGYKVGFELLDVGNFLKESLLEMGEICIFMSATILDINRFTDELGISRSEVKFIHNDLPFDSQENKIYSRNSFDMKDKYLYENREFLVEVIREILNKHKHQNGIIHAKSKYIDFIRGSIKDKRLIFHNIENFESKISKLKKGNDLVLVTDSIDESIEFQDNSCGFQIFLNQPIAIWGMRPKRKDELEAHWYDYRTAINLIQKMQRVIGSKEDSCITYMLDEKFSMFIQNDILENKIIPKEFLNSIEDLDISQPETISENINKKFGVYYLVDYVPTGKSWRKIRKKYDYGTKQLSKKIHNYKDYEKKNPRRFKEDFDYFTKKLMNAISEFSVSVLDNDINKIALFSVPSSTVKRDNMATIRESINVIEDWYKSGMDETDYGLKKEIINCGDCLKRISDVNTSHDPNKRRPSYIEHKKSIKCCENNILLRSDVAFVILDDITTRGTIMNACEDILIENGVNKNNIYKFAIAKTVGFYD